MALTLKSENEYEAALERVNELWDVPRNTPAGVERDALFAAIEEYEAEHYPIGDPESYAAVEYHLERLNLTVDKLPIPDDQKRLLAACIANNVLVPDWLLTKLSNIFEVPREALGIGDASSKSIVKEKAANPH